MLSQITLLVVIALASSHPTYPTAQADSGYHTYPEPQAAPEPEINIDYKMSMSVQDEETGNYQTKEETKEGKIIKGSYTVLEPTGELRVVNYYADENGFQADVQNKPAAAPAYKPQYPKEDHYAPAAAPPKAYATPVLAAVPAAAPPPRAYATPVLATVPAAAPHYFVMSQPKVVVPAKKFIFTVPAADPAPKDDHYHQTEQEETRGY